MADRWWWCSQNILSLLPFQKFVSILAFLSNFHNWVSVLDDYPKCDHNSTLNSLSVTEFTEFIKVGENNSLEFANNIMWLSYEEAWQPLYNDQSIQRCNYCFGVQVLTTENIASYIYKDITSMFWKEKYMSEIKYILVYQIALDPRASTEFIKPPVKGFFWLI